MNSSLKYTLCAVGLASLGAVAFIVGSLGGTPSNDPRVEVVRASLARADLDAANRDSILCDTAALADQLLREQPFDAVLLSRYVGVAQLLHARAITCSNITTPSVDQILALTNLAVERAPNHRGVLLTAALIYRWLLVQAPDQFERLTEDHRIVLSRILRSPGELSPQQRLLLTQELADPKVIEELTDMGLREARLIALLRLRSEAGPSPFGRFDSLAMEHAIERVQLAALEKSGVRDELLRLRPLAATPKVQQLIDQKLAKASGLERFASPWRNSPFRGGTLTLSQLYAERGALAEMPVARCLLTNRANTQRGTCLEWGDQWFAALDTQQYSFVVAADRHQLRALMLSSPDPQARMNPEELEFLVSDDNQSWRPITPSSIGVAREDRGLLLWVALDPSTFSVEEPTLTAQPSNGSSDGSRDGPLFVRVRFVPPVRRETFKGRSQHIVRAFGSTNGSEYLPEGAVNKGSQPSRGGEEL